MRRLQLAVTDTAKEVLLLANEALEYYCDIPCEGPAENKWPIKIPGGLIVHWRVMASITRCEAYPQGVYLFTVSFHPFTLRTFGPEMSRVPLRGNLSIKDEKNREFDATKSLDAWHGIRQLMQPVRIAMNAMHETAEGEAKAERAYGAELSQAWLKANRK